MDDEQCSGLPQRPPWRRTSWVSHGLEQLIKRADSQPAQFDVVIVGSGYGGAVAADRLAGSCKSGGERLRVVLAGDAAAVDALDPSEPVLLTYAAQRRIGKPLRMLVPPAHFVSPGCAAAVARVPEGETTRGRRSWSRLSAVA